MARHSGEEDRRVIRTKRHLWEALARLMKRKKLKDITVRELSEEAALNRTTFYMHYRDVPDMLDKVEGEVLGALREARSAQPLEAVFRVIGDNRDLILALTGPNGDIGFLHRMMETVYAVLHPARSGQGEYHTVYALGGLAAVLTRWLNEDPRPEPGVMAEWARDLIAAGPRTEPAKSCRENKRAHAKALPVG